MRLSNQRFSRAIPWLLLTVSAAMLALLVNRHRDLRESFLEHRRSDMRLQRGDHVPALATRSTAGDSILVGHSTEAERQIVILLSSTCPFCRETLPFWKRMAAGLGATADAGSSAPAPAMVALTADSVAAARAYVDSNQLPFPLVPLTDVRTAALYKAFVVPQTLVIDGTGRVLFARHGVVNTDAAVDSVMAAFGRVSLGERHPADAPGAHERPAALVAGMEGMAR
ncbi:MAG: peroxiredoxin family protein [Gemmatimonadaceae bacterium]